MIRVKLLKDRSVPLQPSNVLAPKVYRRPAKGYSVTARKGAVMNVSDTTGAKWIAAGLAEATTDALTKEKL